MISTADTTIGTTITIADGDELLFFPANTRTLLLLFSIGDRTIFCAGVWCFFSGDGVLTIIN
jgi:hypothetical protein